MATLVLCVCNVMWSPCSPLRLILIWNHSVETITWELYTLCEWMERMSQKAPEHTSDHLKSQYFLGKHVHRLASNPGFLFRYCLAAFSKAVRQQKALVWSYSQNPLVWVSCPICNVVLSPSFSLRPPNPLNVINRHVLKEFSSYLEVFMAPKVHR